MASGQVCAFCREHPVTDAWRPFCSQRCKMLDLARWLEGAYRIPAEPVPQPDDEHEDDGRHTDSD